MPYAKAFTLIGFILSTYLIYWASWPWTFVGIVLIFSGYPAFIFVRRKNLEIKRNLWIFVYLVLIVMVSILGDSSFEYNNFTDFKPLNILSTPYDYIALTIIAVVIYFWAYKENIKYDTEGKKRVRGGKIWTE